MWIKTFLSFCLLFTEFHICFAFNYSHYLSLNDLNNHLTEVAKNHSDNVKLITIGKSSENRSIFLLTLTAKNKTNKSIFMDCGIHAREWISPSFCLYFLDRLLDDMKNLLNSFTFHIIPMLNPDGYLYSKTSNRMWRKNRRPLDNSELKRLNFTSKVNKTLCNGVDLNRNFDIRKEPKVKPSCNESYSGPNPVSESESKALRKGLLKVKNSSDLVGYFSVHCCLEKLFSPFAMPNTNLSSHDKTVYSQIMKLGSEAIAKVNGAHYKYGSINENKKKKGAGVFGTTLDWVYKTVGVPYSFIIEIAGDFNSTNRFVLKEDKIKIHCQEVTEGIKAMVQEINRIENNENKL